MKDITKACKRMGNSTTIVGFFSAMAESRKKLKTSNAFSLFIECKNRYRSALVRELLSNNSLFVGQLYEDKSLACALVI